MERDEREEETENWIALSGDIAWEEAMGLVAKTGQ
jgi:hypothetical protein